jgi:hypothetical protein
VVEQDGDWQPEKLNAALVAAGLGESAAEVFSGGDVCVCKVKSPPRGLNCAHHGFATMLLAIVFNGSLIVGEFLEVEFGLA